MTPPDDPKDPEWNLRFLRDCRRYADALGISLLEAQLRVSNQYEILEEFEKCKKPPSPPLPQK